MSEHSYDEYDQLRRDIAREVEEAFAEVPYPGDDRLLRTETYYENDDILESFQGKHWKELSPEVLFRHSDNMGALLPEAYRFYLPACMIGALLHPIETDRLSQNVFYDLTPPPSKGDRMDWFCERLAPLDARQKEVARRYVERYVQIEHSLEDPGKDRALLFWRRLTALERAEGADPSDPASATRNIMRAMGWEPAPSEQEAREVKALEQEIARVVEEVFASVPPPADDGSPGSSAQWKDVPESFHGKHWRDISPQMLRERSYRLPWFSPEAFRFFLPAYLIAALLHADETDELRDQLFYNLMPPREEGRRMDVLLANVLALDAPQKQVVRRFVELWARTATCYPDSIKERGLAFWRKATETA